MQPLPSAYLERMQHLLGDQYPAFLAACAEPAVAGLRLNTLKVSPEEFQSISPWPLSPLPWSAAGFALPTEAQPGKHPYHAAGLYYLQDPSAMAAAEVLAPRPGERVLDLAAAPGGKSTHLAALMQNQGLLVTNEIHPQRAWDLAENLERCGVQMACITNETSARLAQAWGGFFDRVLLDAPCSGEGMFRKSERARGEWSPEHVMACASRQESILSEAARLVRPGGWLLYATCTFSAEENERTIGRFLQAHLEYALEPPPAQAGFTPARPDWAPGFEAQHLERALRLWPHRGAPEGHFLALLRRLETGEPARPPEERPARLSAESARLWQDFSQANLNAFSPTAHLAQVGSYLYALPAGLPGLGSLKTLHPGWWLGTLKKNRFEPSHALALGLQAGQARHTLRLGLDDAHLAAYLRGESLPIEQIQAGSAWMLVLAEDHPIGWGKAVQGVLKNAYPRGLRTTWA